MRHPRRRTAFSLLEALIAAVLLLTVVLAISQALLAGQMQIYDAAHRARAIELAQALMEEVLRLPYTDPDGGSEAARDAFDNMDDFDGFAEASPLTNAAGSAYADPYQVFSRSVAVTPGSVNVSEFGGAIAGVTITVTVTDATGATWSLQQFVPEP